MVSLSNRELGCDIHRLFEQGISKPGLWDEGTKNGSDSRAQLGHNTVY